MTHTVKGIVHFAISPTVFVKIPSIHELVSETHLKIGNMNIAT